MRTMTRSSNKTHSITAVADSLMLQQQSINELKYFMEEKHYRILKETDCGNIVRLLVEKECIAYGNLYYEYHVLQYGIRRCFGGESSLRYKDAKTFEPDISNKYSTYEEAYAHM